MAKKEKEVKTKNKKQKSHYFKDMKAELKKVIWPTPKQLLTNTMAVIAFTLIVSVIVLVLDVCFDAINKYGITAAQEKIQSSYNNSNQDSEEETDADDADENSEEDSEENQDEDLVEGEVDIEENNEDEETDNSESQE